MNGLYSFDHDHGAAARDLAGLLGGKGAGLAEMTAALGMSVPPGFTISVPLCRAYRESGWPDGLDEALAEHIDRLGERMGRRFGDPENPLLVSVRSGAPVSMPGMLDTVLNLGLNERTVRRARPPLGRPRVRPRHLPALPDDVRDDGQGAAERGAGRAGRRDA